MQNFRLFTNRVENIISANVNHNSYEVLDLKDLKLNDDEYYVDMCSADGCMVMGDYDGKMTLQKTSAKEKPQKKDFGNLNSHDPGCECQL